MTDSVFDSLWSTIHLFFGGTAPSDGRKALCKQKTKHIPDAAAKWIVDRFEQMDSKPRNITYTIKQLWQSWQESNPDRIVHPEHRCPYCIPGASGSMMVLRRQKGTGTWFEYVVPCGHCQQEGWRTDDQTHGTFWHHCAGGIVPQHLAHLIGINRSEGQVAFRNGAPFHEIVGKMKRATTQTCLPYSNNSN